MIFTAESMYVHSRDVGRRTLEGQSCHSRRELAIPPMEVARESEHKNCGKSGSDQTTAIQGLLFAREQDQRIPTVLVSKHVLCSRSNVQ